MTDALARAHLIAHLSFRFLVIMFLPSLAIAGGTPFHLHWIEKWYDLLFPSGADISGSRTF